MKVRVDPSKAYRLINSGCLALLTTAHKDRTNIMTIAWHMPASFTPPLVAIAVGQSRFTRELIDSSGEFVLNVPPRELLDQVRRAGSKSGREADKIAELGLAISSGRTVKAPVLGECLGHIECRVVNRVEAGDHVIYIAEVTAAEAEDTLFDGAWLPSEGAALVYHLGGTRFVVAEKHVEAD